MFIIRKNAFLFMTAFRNIFRHKRRSLLSALAITLSVIFVVGMNSMFQGIFDRQSREEQIFHHAHLTLYSVDQIKNEESHSLLYPLSLKEGRYPAGKKEIAVGAALLRKLKLNPGETLTFSVRSRNLSVRYYRAEITGVFDFANDEMNANYILIPYDVLENLAGYDGETSQGLYVFVDDPDRSASFRKALLAPLGEGAVARNWSDQFFVILFKAFKIQRLMYAVIFVMIASFLLILSTLMVIKERKREIGVMTALGMGSGEIISLFFYEALIISFLGAFLGTVINYAYLSFFRNGPLVLTTMKFGQEVKSLLSFQFSHQTILSGCALVFLFSVALSVFPCLKAAGYKPVEALRG